MLLLSPLWNPMGGGPSHLAPYQAFSFGRPGDPHLETNEQLLSSVWNLLEGSPHVEPHQGSSFGRHGETHLEPEEVFPFLLLSPLGAL